MTVVVCHCTVPQLDFTRICFSTCLFFSSDDDQSCTVFAGQPYRLHEVMQSNSFSFTESSPQGQVSDRCWRSSFECVMSCHVMCRLEVHLNGKMNWALSFPGTCWQRATHLGKNTRFLEAFETPRRSQSSARERIRRYHV